MNKTYIGDGVYATHDGFGIKLEVYCPEGIRWLYLKPDVMRSLVRLDEQAWRERQALREQRVLRENLSK